MCLKHNLPPANNQFLYNLSHNLKKWRHSWSLPPTSRPAEVKFWTAGGLVPSVDRSSSGGARAAWPPCHYKWGLHHHHLYFSSSITLSLKWLITSGNLHRKDVIRSYLEVMMKMNSLAMAMKRMIGKSIGKSLPLCLRQPIPPGRHGICHKWHKWH